MRFHDMCISTYQVIISDLNNNHFTITSMTAWISVLHASEDLQPTYWKWWCKYIRSLLHMSTTANLCQQATNMQLRLPTQHRQVHIKWTVTTLLQSAWIHCVFHGIRDVKKVKSRVCYDESGYWYSMLISSYLVFPLLKHKYAKKRQALWHFWGKNKNASWRGVSVPLSCLMTFVQQNLKAINKI